MEITPDISICTVTQDRPDLIRHHILSVLSSTASILCEIIVADDQQAGRTRVFFDQEFPEVVVYEIAAEDTLVQARNRAMQVAQGRYIFLCDNGVIIRKGCISRLLEFMDDNPFVGLAGPKIILPDQTTNLPVNTTRTFLRFLFKSAIKNNLFLKAKKNDPHSFPPSLDVDSTSLVNLLNSPCLLIRRETIEEIGFLNERLAAECCYIEYCLRAQLAGWHIYHVHDAEVLLLGSKHPNPASNRFIIWYLKSMIYFLFKKWFSSRR